MSLKRILSKLAASIMIIYMLFGNILITGIKLGKVIAQNLQASDILMECETQKYVQYNTNGFKGVVLQDKTSISQQCTKETYLPAQKVQLEIEVPEINEVLPSRINIIQASTMATTGKEQGEIIQNYDSNTGLLIISYQSNEELEYRENVKDEFEIIYIYSQAAYTENAEVEISKKIKASIDYKTENGTITTEKETIIKNTQKENIGEIANYETISASEIYKGYLYANEENDANYETNYKVTTNLSILNKELIDEVRIELAKSSYIEKENETIIPTDTIEYQSSMLSEEDFYKMFGKEGYIDFYLGNTKYATIKYSDADENGNRTYTTVYNTQEKENVEAGKVEYPEETVSVTIVTSKPQTEGNITIENEKRIKAKADYDIQVKQITAIKETNKIETNKKEVIEQDKKDESGEVILDENGNVQKEQITKTMQINSKENIGIIYLKEPTTKVDLSINNTNLSTLTENQIIITATLRTDNVQYRLFKDPVIEIELPDGIQKITTDNIQLLYAQDTLKIKKATIYDNKKIIIEFEGKQKDYNIGSVQEGASVVIPLTVKFDVSTPSQDSKIRITTDNQGEKVSSEVGVELLSKEGLMSITNIKGYNGDKTLTVIDNTKQDAILEVGQSAKTAQMQATLVNNYDKNLNNVIILGTVSKAEEIPTKMIEEINVSKEATIYYSESANAQITDSTWVTDIKDISKIKSYMIVIKNINAKEIIKFGYSFMIPSNLSYNKETQLEYKLYYTFEENKTTSRATVLTNAPTEQETVSITLKTQEVPEVNVEVTPNISLDYVHERQIVEYNIKITNNSQETMQNIKIKDIIPNDAIYCAYTNSAYGEHAQGGFKPNPQMKEYTTTIDQLIAGQSYEETIYLQMQEVEEEKIVTNIVQAFMDVQTVGSNICVGEGKSEVVVKKASFDVELDYMTATNVIHEGEEVEFYLHITNLTDKNVKNIIIEDVLDEDLNYLETTLVEENVEIKSADYNQENKKLTITISKINAGETASVCIRTKLNNHTNYNQKELRNKVLVKPGNLEQYETNVIYYIAKGSSLSIEMTSTTKTNIIEYDSITYKIVVKNEGDSNVYVKVQDNLPQEVLATKVTYYTKSDSANIGDLQVEHTIDIVEMLEAKDELIINIIGTAQDIGDVNEKEITNKAVLYRGVTIDSIEDYHSETQTITHVIEKREDDSEDNTDPDNPDNPDESNKTFTIRGTAWIDENKNGQRDTNETLMSGINVTAINADTNTIIKKEDGTDYIVTTLEDGTYIIEGLSKGNYILLFEYDTNTYTVTSYQKNGIDQSINSDVINKNVIINGESKLVAMTDTMTINETGISNVDIGLIENPVFDLSLDKQISNITVINAKGSTKTDYTNTNFAKIDLVAKYMNNTNMIITYQFTITNNGDVTGYVDELVDNLPNGLEFSSELNQDWYKGTDGNLYSNILSGIAIQPGEEKQVELILTKKTTEETTGTFTNNAALTKISNMEAIQEKEDAIENNKSSADIVISIKTGSAILYIGITILCIAIILVGAYMVKKKVLGKEQNNEK